MIPCSTETWLLKAMMGPQTKVLSRPHMTSIQTKYHDKPIHLDSWYHASIIMKGFVRSLACPFLAGINHQKIKLRLKIGHQLLDDNGSSSAKHEEFETS